MLIKRIKFLGLLIIIISLAVTMAGCDMGDDAPESVSDVTISVDQTESMGFDVFRARRTNLRFIIEELEEGTLKFTTEEGITVPGEVKFTGGEASVENLFSKAEAETLIVTAKNSEGAEADQISLALEEVELDDSAEVLADNYYGFFLPGEWANSDYEWTYLAAGYIRELEWDKVTAIIGHLNDNVDSSFFVDSLVRDKYSTWRRYRAGSPLENEFNDFFSEEGIADYYDAARDEGTDLVGYNVTVNYNDGKGTVTGDGDYEEGEEVELTATAKEGYEFLEWTGYKVSTEDTVTFDMPAEDVEFVAHYVKLVELFDGDKVWLLKDLGPEGNLDFSDNVYNIYDASGSLHVLLWGVELREDRLPEELKGFEGYKLIIDDVLNNEEREIEFEEVNESYYKTAAITFAYNKAIIRNSVFKKIDKSILVLEKTFTGRDVILGDMIEGKLRIENHDKAKILKLPENVVFDTETGEEELDLDTANPRVSQDGDDLLLEFDENYPLWDIRDEEKRGEIEFKLLDQEENVLDSLMVDVEDED